MVYWYNIGIQEFLTPASQCHKLLCTSHLIAIIVGFDKGILLIPVFCFFIDIGAVTVSRSGFVRKTKALYRRFSRHVIFVRKTKAPFTRVSQNVIRYD